MSAPLSFNHLMRVLAIDIGSSSIKSAMLENGKVVGKIARTSYDTNRDGVRSEVIASDLLAAFSTAVKDVPNSRHADILALSVMAPAWVAMDRDGNALTPLITHQDRRSVAEARELIELVGEEKLLSITGNLPFPGGISSTTLRWAFAHLDGLASRTDLVGHLNTFLIRQLTGERVIDPGNASFTGLYETTTLGGWSREMLEVNRVNELTLPRVVEGNAIAGCVSEIAATIFGLKQGLPVTTGVIDTSSAMLLEGADEGRLLHICGTTDVLAICTNAPLPDKKILTRALGVNGLWMHAATLASAGSTVDWLRATFFENDSDEQFAARLASDRISKQSSVNFEPYLAGERTSLEQRKAALTGLSLNTTRDEVAQAVMNGLSRVSADRMPLLLRDRRAKEKVLVSGGAGIFLEDLFHQQWPDYLRYHKVEEATLLGLWKLAEMAE